MLRYKSGFSISLAVMLLVAASAAAHCDREDGPVANDARAALAGGEFTKIAVWVGEAQTDELRRAFDQTRTVRSQSEEARELADRWFIETAVRLHRAAEGMPYTGLQPAGLPAPAEVAAADKAYAADDVEPVIELLESSLEEHVRSLFTEAMRAKKEGDKSLEAGREKIDAYVRFILYVHGLVEKIEAGPEHGVGEHSSVPDPHNTKGATMNTVSADRTVGDLVTEQPGRAKVFEDLGIDYCCGGHRPLTEACAEKGIDPENVLAQLARVDAARRPDADADYGSMSLTALADHIVDTHHAYLRQALPRANQLAAKVAQAHAASPKGADLKRVDEHVRALAAELQSHMVKEEHILFPMIRRIDAGERGLVIDGPVMVMMREHDEAGEALAAIRTLTDDFALPAWGCNTYRAMLDALQELELDLHQHIHKENNVLFPRAQQAAAVGA